MYIVGFAANDDEEPLSQCGIYYDKSHWVHAHDPNGHDKNSNKWMVRWESVNEKDIITIIVNYEL